MVVRLPEYVHATELFLSS